VRKTRRKCTVAGGRDEFKLGLADGTEERDRQCAELPGSKRPNESRFSCGAVQCRLESRILSRMLDEYLTNDRQC
jgi:hypothetical protein